MCESLAKCSKADVFWILYFILNMCCNFNFQERNCFTYVMSPFWCGILGNNYENFYLHSISCIIFKLKVGIRENFMAPPDVAFFFHQSYWLCENFLKNLEITWVFEIMLFLRKYIHLSSTQWNNWIAKKKDGESERSVVIWKISKRRITFKI